VTGADFVVENGNINIMFEEFSDVASLVIPHLYIGANSTVKSYCVLTAGTSPAEYSGPVWLSGSPGSRFFLEKHNKAGSTDQHTLLFVDTTQLNTGDSELGFSIESSDSTYVEAYTLDDPEAFFTDGTGGDKHCCCRTPRVYRAARPATEKAGRNHSG